MPCANTEAMNLHLQEIAAAVAPGADAVRVVDGAGWHGATALALPANLSIVTLPPYSPEPNPVENLWEYLRKNKLANRPYENCHQIVDACCQAWSDLMNAPTTITSITRRDWAHVS